MGNQISTGAVNHVALTVTDLPRPLDFHTGLLGFRKLMNLSSTRLLLANDGGVLLAFCDPDNLQLELTAPRAA